MNTARVALVAFGLCLNHLVGALGLPQPEEVPALELSVFEIDPLVLPEKKMTQKGQSALPLHLESDAFSYFLSQEKNEEEVLPEPPVVEEEGHHINFSEVPVVEFIRFVSKISEANFIFNQRDLDFTVSLTSGKKVTAQHVLGALIRVLRLHGFWVNKEDDYFVVHKIDPKNPPPPEWDTLIQEREKIMTEVKELIAGIDIPEPVALPPPPPPESIETVSEPVKEPEPFEFFVYKLKYHEGHEIQEALKQVALELKMQPGTPHKFLNAVQSVQWVRATNSLLCSGERETIEGVKKLVDSLDKASKQVFIEVLVIETDVNNGLDFGLQWAASGKLQNGLSAGAGGFPRSIKQPPFARTMQGIDAGTPPAGLSQFPVGSGFDLGVIGDIIFHKGQSFLSLGSLVSALQVDGGSTIVLNQKIIAQDNKPSQIFVGDNIPFTGSVVQMVGQNQQTTANIEYRDIGVNLNIKPMVGDDDVITLDLQEEISETVGDPAVQAQQNQASGIRTTKTNMVTHVHVPDKHFLIISGMMRNAKSHHKQGLPCLGGIPYIGSLFSKKTEQNEKRNIIIFVRPHIIRTVDEYRNLSGAQRELHRKHASEPADFDEGMELIPHIP